MLITCWSPFILKSDNHSFTWSRSPPHPVISLQQIAWPVDFLCHEDQRHQATCRRPSSTPSSGTVCVTLTLRGTRWPVREVKQKCGQNLFFCVVPKKVSIWHNYLGNKSHGIKTYWIIQWPTRHMPVTHFRSLVMTLKPGELLVVCHSFLLGAVLKIRYLNLIWSHVSL